jgi:hypothetical protein
VRIARLAALIVVASCRNVLDANPLSPTGTYTLVRLDGGSLPAAVATGLTVRGAMVLQSNSKYTLTQSDSAAGSATNTSVTGTWVVTDNALQLLSDSNALLLGVVYGDSVKMDYRGHQNLYVRQ